MHCMRFVNTKRGLLQSQAAAGQAAGSEAGPMKQPEGQPAEQQASRRQPRQDLPQNYVANMLGAIGALQKHEKYALVPSQSVCMTQALWYI